MLEYKDKRKIVDDLKETLQREIMEYTKLTEAGKLIFDRPKFFFFF